MKTKQHATPYHLIAALACLTLTAACGESQYAPEVRQVITGQPAYITLLNAEGAPSGYYRIYGEASGMEGEGLSFVCNDKVVRHRYGYIAHFEGERGLPKDKIITCRQPSSNTAIFPETP